MADDAIKADVVKRFHTIPGLGLTKADLLFDAGFTTVSSLKKASVDEVAAVKGITKSLAKYILREVRDMPDEAPPDEGKVEAPSVDDPESATISVTEAVPGEETEEGEEEADEESDEAEVAEGEPGEEGPGMFNGLINGIKSFFSSEEEVPEQGDSGLSADEIEAAKAVSTGEVGPEEEAPAEEEEVKVEEPTEASISVDHGKEEVKPEEKVEEVEEGATSEETIEAEPEAGPEAEEPQDAGPSIGETAMNIASDIKSKGMARINAIRERLKGKGKPPEEKVEQEDAEPADEKPEEPEAKDEGSPEEKEEPEKEPPKDKRSDTSDILVDDIIKDLDLDEE